MKSGCKVKLTCHAERSEASDSLDSSPFGLRMTEADSLAVSDQEVTLEGSDTWEKRIK